MDRFVADRLTTLEVRITSALSNTRSQCASGSALPLHAQPWRAGASDAVRIRKALVSLAKSFGVSRSVLDQGCLLINQVLGIGLVGELNQGETWTKG